MPLCNARVGQNGPVPASIRLPDGTRLRPLTARSVVLSTLLGKKGGSATPYELVLVGRELGITETALRASLSRMLEAGDVVRADGRYRLAARLVERQRRQDEAAAPPAREWDGTWHIAIVTASGRPSAERAELRAALRGSRLAELRGGVWMRPGNLAAGLTPRPEIDLFSGAKPHMDDRELAGQLWDLPGWAETARHLLEGFHDAATNAARFTIVAAIVRHLLVDPVLPSTLLPATYPADELRRVYADFRGEMLELGSRMAG